MPWNQEWDVLYNGFIESNEESFKLLLEKKSAKKEKIFRTGVNSGTWSFTRIRLTNSLVV